jgi:hypothetical protein
MRPPDFCHPNQDDDPLVVRSRLLEPLSRSGTPMTIHGRHEHDRGTGRFHDARDRFDPFTSNANPRAFCLAALDTSTGLFDPWRFSGRDL